MRTEQSGQADPLRTYARELAQRPARPAEADGERATGEAQAAAGEERARLPRELSKGRLLDIYG